MTFEQEWNWILNQVIQVMMRRMDIFKVRPIIVNLDKTEHNIINMHQVKEVSTHTGNPTMMMLVIEAPP
jgi:hypothetical protein